MSEPKNTFKEHFSVLEIELVAHDEKEPNTVEVAINVKIGGSGKIEVWGQPLACMAILDAATKVLKHRIEQIRGIKISEMRVDASSMNETKKDTIN